MGTKGRGKIKTLMGTTPEGLPDTPRKMSNVMLARIVHGQERGCERCFPHGFETSNGTVLKNWRSWKHYRGTQHHTK